MHTPFVSQRTLRNCLPGLVFLSLCLLLVATTRSLQNDSSLPKPSVRLGKHPKDKNRHSSQKQKPIPSHPPIKIPPLKPAPCTPELDFLRRQELGLTEMIRYTRRCIRPVRSANVDRNVVTNFSSPLVNTARMATINLTSCARTELPPCEVLELPVPNPYPERKYQHLLFGIASSYARMESSIDAFATWLSGTGAQLYVIIQDADRHDLSVLQRLYRGLDIEATFVPPPLFKIPQSQPSKEQTQKQKPKPKQGGKDTETEEEKDLPPTIEHLHFFLIRNLLSFSKTNPAPGVTKWMGIIDDDTFLPHLHPLDSKILSKFDASKSVWIGALSDDFNAVSLWGFMAFGGAGIFLSLPLARELEPHIEICIKKARIQSGDGILKECIYHFTRTKLDIVKGLYQHDIHGDVSGFYEGISEVPVSLHHWRSWYKEEGLPRGVLVGREVCGGCWLQRFRFKGRAGQKNAQGETGKLDGGTREIDGGEAEEGINDVLLVNGYSISEYFPAPPPSSSSSSSGALKGSVGEEDEEWGPRPDFEEKGEEGEEEEEEEEEEEAEGTWKAGPGGLDSIDLSRIEGTWGHAFNGEFDFSYGPLREKLGPARKKSYKLVDVDLVFAEAGNHEVVGGTADVRSSSRDKLRRLHVGKDEKTKELRQVYVHRKSDAWQPEEGAMDEVIELVWEV